MSSPVAHSCREVERELLGALLLDAERLPDVREIVRPEDFEVPLHRIVFEGVLALADGGAGLDLSSVAAWLGFDPRGRRAAPDGGWAKWLVEAASSVTSSAFVPHHARIVSESASLRGLTLALRRQADLCTEVHAGTGDEVPDFLAQTEAAVYAIGQRSLGRTTIHELASVAHEVADGLDRPSGALPTGIADLDDLLHGLRPGEMVILAARPGCGKTALALQVALNVARAGRTALFLSLEMSRVDLGQRILANLGGVHHERIRSGCLRPDERRALEEARTLAGGLRLGLVEDSATPCSRLRALARRRSSKAGLDLLVVDYLQLMSHPGSPDRFQEVGAISRGLKALARELSVPVMAVSQLSRAAAEGRPRLSHLRESGALEQDADVVVLLWTEAERGPLHCAVEKNRHGRTGKTCLAFRREFQQIAGLAREEVVRA